MPTPLTPFSLFSTINHHHSSKDRDHRHRMTTPSSFTLSFITPSALPLRHLAPSPPHTACEARTSLPLHIASSITGCGSSSTCCRCASSWFFFVACLHFPKSLSLQTGSLIA
ncbi:hypothetical protein PIB30_047912, partial [Stylosanthes scabra]|nr:hypothetical protein [Stylosanthes scabra]